MTLRSRLLIGACVGAAVGVRIWLAESSTADQTRWIWLAVASAAGGGAAGLILHLIPPRPLEQRLFHYARFALAGALAGAVAGGSAVAHGAPLRSLIVFAILGLGGALSLAMFVKIWQEPS